MEIDPKEYCTDKKLPEQFGYILEEICRSQLTTLRNVQCSHLSLASIALGDYTKAIADGRMTIPEYNHEHNGDAINPSHYRDGKYQVVDFIESWGFSYWLGNTVKYISRAGKKDPSKEKFIEDLTKAKWYLDDYTSRLLAGTI